MLPASLVVLFCFSLVMLLDKHIFSALFHEQKFDSYIHVRLDVTACIKRYPGTGKSECCQCVLAFEGRRNTSDLNFIGNNLKSRYDAEHRTYFISGDGIVTDGKNNLELRDGEIFLNKQKVVVRSTPMNVLLTKTGNLENQFFD